MNGEQEIKGKIAGLEARLRAVTQEKGAAAIEGGGWHDNPAFDILQEEELMIREQIRNLREQLWNAQRPA